MGELGDLLELLHGARHRYRNLRATVRDWSHAELSERAWERYEEASGGSVARLVAVRREGAGDPEPEPTESEGLTRLWWEPPDRVREERPEGPGRHLHIVDGDRWWAYWPGQGAVSNADDPSVRSSAEAPRPELFDPAVLLGMVDLEPLGPVSQAGRPALRVRARPRPIVDTMDRHLPGGADLHELVVDAERGVLLRLASLIDGREYQVAEIVEIAFDEDFPPDTFVFTPLPGSRWPRSRRRRRTT